MSKDFLDVRQETCSAQSEYADVAAVLEQMDKLQLLDCYYPYLMDIAEREGFEAWFAVNRHKHSYTYENNTWFIEARVLEYLLNTLKLPPSVAEEVMRYYKAIATNVAASQNYPKSTNKQPDLPEPQQPITPDEDEELAVDDIGIFNEYNT